jgi:large subunit ribosomal protein L6
MTMALGYSHPIVFKLPKGVSAKVEKNRIMLSSADRDLVGQTAAKVRELRPPEPYKGKGVKYMEEVIKRKVGKAGATSSSG